MKTIYKSLLWALTATLSLSSCSFLDVEPDTILAPETYYKSEAELKYGLAGVYGAINNEEFYGNYYSLMISNADDLCYQNRSHDNSGPYWYNFSTTDSYIYRCWTMIYAGIKNANEYMEAVAKTNLDPNKKYISEARFLRAYYYFVLAQAWGDVPLRTSAATSPSNVQLAATSQAEILKWCVSEMEDCVTYFGDSVELAPYRVTKTTVEGILARVYLFMAGATVNITDKTPLYTKAAYWAHEVITSGKHHLNPSYSQIFINMISDKYDTSYYESMWEADFIGNRTSADQWSNGRIGDLLGLQSTSATTNYSEWACNYSYGWYNGSLKLWDLYWADDRTDDENQLGTINDSRQSWNMPPYNYAGNTTLGLAASIDKTPYVYNSISSLNDPTAAVCKRNCGKFRRETIYEPAQSGKNLYTTINFPILRYSDVLLMYAEAQNELSASNTAEAYTYVKQIRDRAGIKTRDASEYASQENMRTLIRNERGREFAFEGLRKWDLIRWGTFVSEMKTYAQWTADARWTKDATAAYARETGNNVQPKHVYLPIPATELGVNKLLKQNPLW